MQALCFDLAYYIQEKIMAKYPAMYHKANKLSKELISYLKILLAMCPYNRMDYLLVSEKVEALYISNLKGYVLQVYYKLYVYIAK